MKVVANRDVALITDADSTKPEIIEIIICLKMAKKKHDLGCFCSLKRSRDKWSLDVTSSPWTHVCDRMAKRTSLVFSHRNLILAYILSGSGTPDTLRCTKCFSCHSPFYFASVNEGSSWLTFVDLWPSTELFANNSANLISTRWFYRRKSPRWDLFIKHLLKKIITENDQLKGFD